MTSATDLGVPGDLSPKNTFAQDYLLKLNLPELNDIETKARQTNNNNRDNFNKLIYNALNVNSSSKKKNN